MFTTFRLTALSALLCTTLSFPVNALSVNTAKPEPGQFAEQSLRNIATWFPGRMAGSPAELLTTDYLLQQFLDMGYQSNKRNFNTSYVYHYNDGHDARHYVTATSVIAAREGKLPETILIVAHLDTWRPQNDNETENNLGGLRLQGADDNASGLGVMLELAQQMQKMPLYRSIRFVALSGTETHQQGIEDYIARMTPAEKKNTLLVINLDSLVVGERLYFNYGRHTQSTLAKKISNQALTRARHAGIKATSIADGNQFDDAGLPQLDVKAAYRVQSDQQQRAVSSHFPQGVSRHQTDIDNLDYLDHWLPGQISHRTHDSVAILLPILTELVNPASELPAKKGIK